MLENDSIRVFSCCDEESGSDGCNTGSHVYKLEDCEDLAKLVPFTLLDIKKESEKGHVVLALDCEMGYTTFGMELIRLTVVYRFFSFNAFSE